MSANTLTSCRILVVEDEYMLADEVRTALEKAGATVVGPVATVARALALAADEKLHAAVLDVNLGGEMAFDLADRLMAQGVPVIFATGYDASAIPERFKTVSRCEKPLNMNQVVRTLAAAIAG